MMQSCDKTSVIFERIGCPEKDIYEVDSGSDHTGTVYAFPAAFCDFFGRSTAWMLGRTPP